MSLRARLGVLSTALLGVMVGLFFYIQSPSCAFADNLCMVGETRTFANNIDIYGGTSYKTVLTTANTLDRTITLPDASSGLIGATSTDTLTNKSIDFLTGGNTGTNYDANTLNCPTPPCTLPANVVTSSLQNLGVQSQVELGSIGTTLIEPSAGNVAIETKEIYRANGVTIPVDDGGTGVTSLPTGHVLIGDDANPITTLDMTNQGHLVVGDGTGPPSTLAPGVNGEHLTADSTEPTGMKWAGAPAGGYTVIDAYTNGTYSSLNGTDYWPSCNRSIVQLGSSEGFIPGGVGNIGTWQNMPYSGACSWPNIPWYKFAETGYYDVAFSICGYPYQNQEQEIYGYGTNNSFASSWQILQSRVRAVYSGYNNYVCTLGQGIMKATTTTDSGFYLYMRFGQGNQFFNYDAGSRVWIKKIADI